MRELNPNLLTFDCLLFFHRFQVPFHADPGFPGRPDRLITGKANRTPRPWSPGLKGFIWINL